MNKRTLITVGCCAVATFLAWMLFFSGFSPFPETRLAAVKRATDQKRLVRFAVRDRNQDVRDAAAMKLTVEGVDHLTEPKTLIHISVGKAEREVRAVASEQLFRTLGKPDPKVDPHKDPSMGVFKRVPEQVKSQEDLALIVVHHVGGAHIHQGAVRNLTPDGLLAAADKPRDAKRRALLSICSKIIAAGEVLPADTRNHSLIELMPLADVFSEPWWISRYGLVESFEIRSDVHSASYKAKEATESFRVRGETVIAAVTFSELDEPVTSEWDSELPGVLRVHTDKLHPKIKIEELYAPLLEDALHSVTDQAILAQIAVDAEHLKIAEAAANTLTDQALLAQLATTHRNLTVREAAVWKLTDQSLLARIAVEDEEPEIRKDAARKIDDQAILTQLAEDGVSRAVEKLTDQTILARFAEDEKPLIRSAAAKVLTDQGILERLALNDKSEHTRQIAVRRLTNQDLIAQIALNDSSKKVQSMALSAINDQKCLVTVATESSEDGIRGQAIERLTDQDALGQIVLQASSKYDRQKAAKNLSVDNQPLLEQVALEDSDSDVRYIVVSKLTDQSLLAEIAVNDGNADVRYGAVFAMTEDNQTFFEQVLTDEQDAGVRGAAVRKLTNQSLVSKIAAEDESEFVRNAARRRSSELLSTDE